MSLCVWLLHNQGAHYLMVFYGSLRPCHLSRQNRREHQQCIQFINTLHYLSYDVATVLYIQSLWASLTHHLVHDHILAGYRIRERRCASVFLILASEIDRMRFTPYSHVFMYLMYKINNIISARNILHKIVHN